MRRISLNPQNSSFPPARDDGTVALSDIEYFLASDPRPHFRLTTATSLQLVEAGIDLKNGWQGLRLTLFYVRRHTWVVDGVANADRCLKSSAVIFQMRTNEVADLNTASYEYLLAVWHRIADKLEYFDDDQCHSSVAVDGIRWE